MKTIRLFDIKVKECCKATFLLFFLVYVCPFTATAAPGAMMELPLEEDQQSTVTGTVVSADDGLPLPGVNVLVQGTSIGAVTDLDGEYSIEVPSEESVLVFSYVGFVAQEILVGDQSEINVSLAADSESLGEVVVVGYGRQERETLTGAVETVSSEVFESRAVTNPALALQGQTPGLTITRSSSRPGNEGIGINIRGATSVNGGGPLIVIDGTPALNGNAFHNMNPDDIESISVLKDGAASIYGSRAANGVILVTTKRGKGELTITLESNFRANTIGIRPTVGSMEEYASVWLEAADQDAENMDFWGWQSRENLERMQRGEEGIYPTEFWGDIFIGNYSRFDEMYETSYSNQQNLSISGATDNTNYRLSAGYAENVGNLATAYDGKEQYNLRFNYDYDINDWLELESGVSYFNTTVSSPSGGFGVNSVAMDPPFWPAQNPYGQWLANFNIAGNRNAVANSVAGGRTNSEIDQLRLNFKGIINFTENLRFEATANIDQEFYRNQSYKLNVPQYTWYGEVTQESINPTTSINQSSNKNVYQNYGGFLYYDFEIGNGHNFSMMVGNTAEKYEYENLYGYRQGFEDNGVYDLNLGSQEDLVTNSGGRGHDGFYSYLARFNYDYKEKYLLEVTGRRDGSSKFHPDFRWSNFPYASVGWVVSEEGFMENLDALNFLKFRASYGEMGNQAGIGRYDYLSAMGFGTAVFGVPASYHNSAWLGGLTSLDRTWERVKMTNFGADLRLFENRLVGSFDYFIKENDGMLISINYPDLLGGSAPRSNSGVLETRGWEVQLGWNDYLGDDFSYNIAVNMSDNTNELVSMEGVSTFNAGWNSTVQGYPLNSYFLYQTDGFFEDQAAVDNYYQNLSGNLPSAGDATQALRPGDTRRLDVDGNGVIEGTGNVNDENGDVVYMGDAAPHYIFGINLGAQFKGFDFTAFFQGHLEQNLMRSGYMDYPFHTTYTNQTPAYLGQTWTPENTNAQYPRMTANTTRATWNWANNDFMLQNSRYIRLKSLIVGYTLPELTIGDTSISRVRVYFSGNDLFELTSIKDGYDPEFGESSNNSYPFNRTYSLGVNITL